MALCKKIDDFIRYKTIWVANLSNGETIYQDDNREGESEPIAWFRLRSYLKKNPPLYILSLLIQFCDHVEQACEVSEEGYYYSQGAYNLIGDTTHYFYILGSLHGDTVHATRWDIPSLIPINKESRKVSPDSIFTIRFGDNSGKKS
jgi:hypothetical protein